MTDARPITPPKKPAPSGALARAWQAFQERVGILQKEEKKLESDMRELEDAVATETIKNKINSLPK